MCIVHSEDDVNKTDEDSEFSDSRILRGYICAKWAKAEILIILIGGKSSFQCFEILKLRMRSIFRVRLWTVQPHYMPAPLLRVCSSRSIPYFEFSPQMSRMICANIAPPQARRRLGLPYCTYFRFWAGGQIDGTRW